MCVWGGAGMVTVSYNYFQSRNIKTKTQNKKTAPGLNARDEGNKYAWTIDFIISFHPSFVLSLLSKGFHCLSLYIQVLGRLRDRMKYLL